MSNKAIENLIRQAFESGMREWPYSERSIEDLAGDCVESMEELIDRAVAEIEAGGAERASNEAFADSQCSEPFFIALNNWASNRRKAAGGDDGGE